MNMEPRLATLADVAALAELEQASFSGDSLSARRFRHFIRGEHSELWCLGDPIQAYALVLFHRGTSLARLYSIAVDPAARGRGFGSQLLHCVEQQALRRHVLFMRLEVRQDNMAAKTLYESSGYRIIRTLKNYYEDGADGWRLEKHLKPTVAIPHDLPFYAQTTPFTCGPSALMMALHSIDPDFTMTRLEELNLWREATTIYLTTGHGGTSPQGLALAALKRGHDVTMWLSDRSIAFLDGVRSEHKRELMTLVGEDFQARCDRDGVTTDTGVHTVADLRLALAQGNRILLLISTYRLNRNKAPHWVWLVAIDDDYAYLNDPDIDEELDQVATDNMYVPVSLDNFGAMIQYGTKRYMAALLIR
ncbi:GNAT family N-acetyltransferase/peptidase C39 family protein [Thalassolituus oleivorans]|jgi:ribosomal protein S18 acetylase RimI-like enzyme|uniref:GNAT family N-acetyltransferase/peptidase C39 family protein n=1 Tax=Thalassolituus oleivorans TaxID=187493 RepID=UPI0023F49281|nr:GNAT family N-acetyltransferase/peptidase C39 family protein [Thalassolituus oleivorans]